LTDALRPAYTTAAIQQRTTDHAQLNGMVQVVDQQVLPDRPPPCTPPPTRS
jgi:hypothetical protein